ncbi:MAG: hypothetical protein ACLFQ6_03280 [Candidatus Sumerlaeia bacterium]
MIARRDASSDAASGIQQTDGSISRIPGQRPRFTASALLIGAILIALVRLHTYDEPFERDIVTYAITADGMLHGKKLYAEMWDLKPPGIHLSYALAELVVGYGRRTIYVLGVGMAVLTMLAVFAAGRIRGRGVAGGLWAAGFWVIVCHSLALQANQPNTEAFTGFFVAAALAILLWLPETRKRRGLHWLMVMLAGFCLWAATFYKQTFLASAVFLSVGHLIAPGDDGAFSRRVAIVEVMVMAAIGALGWGLALLVMAGMGILRDFYDQVFLFSAAYAGGALREGEGKASILSNIFIGLKPSLLLPRYLYFALFPLLLGVGGLVLDFAGKKHRPWILLISLAVATQIQIAASGQFYPHYYQQWLPLLAIGGGWGAALLWEWARHEPNRLWARSMTIIFVVGLVLHFARDLRLSADEWNYKKYGEKYGEYNFQARALAAEINELLLPGETFYEWGTEPGLYFYSKRRPPADIFYIDPLLFGHSIERSHARLIEDLEQTQPELIILLKDFVTWIPEGGWMGERLLPALEWIREHYRPMPGGADRGPFLFYARKGGALEERLESNSE